MAEPLTMTKGEFASLCNVAPSRVSHWIKEGKIGAAGMVGSGRSARIIVERAQQQLRKRLDIGQRLGNGAETVLDTPAGYTHSGTPEQREARLLGILAGLPELAAGSLERTGVAARVRFAAYLWCKRNIVAELGRSYPVPAFDEPDWPTIAAETGELVDLAGWQAWAEEMMWKT